MCGFCGYVNKTEIIYNDKCIKKMNSSLKFRGPNSQNIYIDQNTAIGHSRLSIIDVTNGTQPMIKNIDNNEFVIVYNGELYNTNELRDNLISKGYTFETKCDTEVILTSYIEYKDKCVNYLNGIFAFAIYNKMKNNIFLARDRLGIKPLFYSITNNTFVFASELKAILEHPDINPILDKYGLMELIGLGPAHTPGKTYFKNINEMLPGYIANFSNFTLNEEKYWDLVTKECNDTEKEAISKSMTLLLMLQKDNLYQTLEFVLCYLVV